MFYTVNTFNFESALIVYLDELLQLIFPPNGLSVVDYISYQNRSTPFDHCNLILGETGERVEIDLRNVLSRDKLEYRPHHKYFKNSTTYISTIFLDNPGQLV